MNYDNIILTQSIKAYSHAKSLIKSYQRASKAESFCDWDRWSTTYLRLLQIYIYISIFQESSLPLSVSRGVVFPPFSQTTLWSTPLKETPAWGGVPMRYYLLPETHLGFCFSLIATLTPEAAEVAPFCPFFAMIEKKPSSRQKSRRIPWELGYSVVYSLCT